MAAVCLWPGCGKLLDCGHITSASIAYDCMFCWHHEEEADCARTKQLKCVKCERYYWYTTCEHCMNRDKCCEVVGWKETADFLDALECPREVLIDLVCRWNIEQDGEALNLPD